MRVAFSGSSGTGKTSLANFVAETYKLPFNTIGARSVAQGMGYASPYDVDAAGERIKFQKMLVNQKTYWEKQQEKFVTDRTPMDNLVYTTFHQATGIDEELLNKCIEGLKRYTHIFFCPVNSFQHLGEDPSRVKNIIYHQLYDVMLKAMLDKFADASKVFTIQGFTLASRQQFLLEHLAGRV